jgi:hypothetical protein
MCLTARSIEDLPAVVKIYPNRIWSWCPVPEIACLSPLVSWLFFKAQATSISESIREERATRKNSQLAAAHRVVMKMGRRLRCTSVTYRFRYAPSLRLAGGPF